MRILLPIALLGVFGCHLDTTPEGVRYTAGSPATIAGKSSAPPVAGEGTSGIGSVAGNTEPQAGRISPPVAGMQQPIAGNTVPVAGKGSVAGMSAAGTKAPPVAGMTAPPPPVAGKGSIAGSGGMAGSAFPVGGTIAPPISGSNAVGSLVLVTPTYTYRKATLGAGSQLVRGDTITSNVVFLNLTLTTQPIIKIRVVLLGPNNRQTTIGGSSLKAPTLAPLGVQSTMASRQFTKSDALGAWSVYTSYTDNTGTHETPRVEFTLIESDAGVGVEKGDD
jgi:hypothetical protein